MTELLGVKGQKKVFAITTLGRADSMEEAQVVNLEVSNKERSFNMPRVFTRRKLPISMQNAAKIDDVAKWAHLRDI